MNTVDEARAEIREVISQPTPVVVSYSGGKDSTLLLLLVIEVALKQKTTAPIYVIFSDTEIEPLGSVERIRRNFEELESLAGKEEINLQTTIIRPKPNERFFNMIVGKGYAPPYPPRLRWCVDRLKLKPIKYWKKSTFGENPFIMATGERLAESANRARSMKKRNPKNERFFKSSTATKFETSWTPLRNVSSEELWSELGKYETFPWGEPIAELYAQYEAKTAKEIIDGAKERRSGCRFCTFCRKKKTGADERENAFCEWLVNYSTQDGEKRHLIDAAKIDRYNDEKHINSRIAVLDKGLSIGISPPVIDCLFYHAF